MYDYGIVYELLKKEALILTDKGSFIAIKRRDDLLKGQFIKYSNTEICSKKTTVSYKMVSAVVSIAAALVLTLYFLINGNMTVLNPIYGFVDVDINPSIEFAINKDYKIINTKYLNEDAKKLCKDNDFKGQTLKNAVLQLIDKSKDAGIIAPDKNNIILISAALNEKKGKVNINTENEIINRILDDVKEDIQESSPEQIDFIETISVSNEVRELALENGISMGKYSLYEKARKQGLDISFDDIKNSKIQEIIYEIENEKQDTKLVNIENTSIPTSNIHKKDEEKFDLTPTLEPTLKIEIPIITQSVEVVKTQEKEKVIIPSTMTSTIVPTKIPTKVPEILKSEVTVTTVPVTGSGVTFYQHIYYNAEYVDSKDKGYVACLDVGKYTTKQLISMGILDNDVSSVKIPKGYIVKIFDKDNFEGEPRILEKDDDDFRMIGLNDIMSSLIVEKSGK